jgi:hypothetical protein
VPECSFFDEARKAVSIRLLALRERIEASPDQACVGPQCDTRGVALPDPKRRSFHSRLSPRSARVGSKWKVVVHRKNKPRIR